MTAMGDVLDQAYDHVRLDQLSPHPANPRRGDVEAIGQSVEANGFYGALVVQRSTGHILAGNHRWLAAQKAGLETVPVIWVDIDDERAKRILLSDNRTNDLAAYDDAALLELLEGLALTPAELAGTSYDDQALDDLRAVIGDEETLPPQQSGAHYAETPEEEAARAATRGLNPSIHQAGLRELVLVFYATDHELTMSALTKLRAAAGPDATNADVVRAAVSLVQPEDVAEWLADQ